MATAVNTHWIHDISTPNQAHTGVPSAVATNSLPTSHPVPLPLPKTIVGQGWTSGFVHTLTLGN